MSLLHLEPEPTENGPASSHRSLKRWFTEYRYFLPVTAARDGKVML